ncbi:hypothetical protein ACEV99_20655 [Vibrio parahaemolyticus]
MDNTSTEQNTQNWPDFYPSDITLPPSDSTDAGGNFYRLVEDTPPTSQCFLTTHQEQPKRHKKCKDLYSKQNVYGLSVFETKDQATDTRAKFEEVLGHKLVANGDFVASDGKIKKTFGPGHHTVWLRTTAKPYERFTVVLET